jgi:hypothetical protein
LPPVFLPCFSLFLFHLAFSLHVRYNFSYCIFSQQILHIVHFFQSFSFQLSKCLSFSFLCHHILNLRESKSKNSQPCSVLLGLSVTFFISITGISSIHFVFFLYFPYPK